jgi:spermidine synthase
MIPWQTLDTATVPDGGELRLMQRGSEFAIRTATTELMNSRLSGSEQALATLSCERIKARKPCSILIGGYGMGFTLRAALAALNTDADITVAEIVPKIVQWARGPMAELTGTSLDDPRVTFRETDVRKIIAESTARFDAILLDVDNGPEGLTRAANDKLYGWAGLKAARKALRPGGIFSVWSSSQNPEFTRRLQQTGFKAEEKKSRATITGKGAHHTIWLATAR